MNDPELVAAEVASMTDEEVLDHFERTDCHEDPGKYRILARDIASRLRNASETHNPYLDAIRELSIEALESGNKELANSIYGKLNRIRSDADQIDPPPGTDRTIPEGSVWKYVFETSHAPFYVRQFENGSFAAIFAPVENVEGNPATPIGLSKENVLEKKAMDHVDVIEVPIDNSPWKEGVYL